MCGPPRRAPPQIPRKPCLKNVWAGRVLFFPSSDIAAPHTNHSKNKKLFSMSKHAGNYRRRIEEKAKVVAAVRGTEFMIQFLAALQI